MKFLQGKIMERQIITAGDSFKPTCHVALSIKEVTAYKRYQTKEFMYFPTPLKNSMELRGGVHGLVKVSKYDGYLYEKLKIIKSQETSCH